VGLTLVVTGVMCLCLSGAVARDGSWWQATLDAFGVGFVVGGIVDVAVISLLNQFLGEGAVKQQEYQNRRAENLLGMYGRVRADSEGAFHSYSEIQNFLRDYGGRIDPLLRSRLRALRDRLERSPEWRTWADDDED
jgi:hypothetical protein